MSKKFKKDKEEKEIDWIAYYDSDEFSQIVLRGIIQSARVYEDAVVRLVTPDDFIAGIHGLECYKEIAKIVFQLKQSPCSRAVFDVHLTMEKANGTFDNFEEDQIDELVNYLFTPDEQAEEYVMEHLGHFLRRRRMYKAFLNNKDNLEAQHAEMSKIVDVLEATEVDRMELSMSPFEQCVKSQRMEGIVTGIPSIDSKTGGLGKGECGLIIGHSGSGKTAVASYMMREAALYGFKVLYIAAEEPMENIVHRWYAQQFGLSYTGMYQGKLEWDKQQKFGQMDNETRQKLARLRISDVRGLAPLTTKMIKDVIEKKADEGFVPDVVLIDQMDYLRPIRQASKGAGRWEEYSNIAFECDLLSQHKIGGVEEFGLWVVHQATGDMQWSFTYNEIAGFKGIVKPFDVAIGVGREDRQSTHINLFSLKVRHTAHFQAPQKADFEYMKFEDDASYKPKAVREKEAAKAARAKSGGTKRISTPVEPDKEEE